MNWNLLWIPHTTGNHALGASKSDMFKLKGKEMQ